MGEVSIVITIDFTDLATKQDLLNLNNQLGATMSTISDTIAAFSAKVEANFATVKTGIAALDAQIQAFNNSPGTLSASDQAALDKIVADSAALAAAASVVVTPGGGGPVATGITVIPTTATLAVGKTTHLTASKVPTAVSVDVGTVSFVGTDITYMAPPTLPTIGNPPFLATITVNGATSPFESATAVITLTA